MKINKLYGVKGAKKARGIVIIVDVFRAATVEAFLLDKGVKEIIPVSTEQEAFSYKKQNPDYILLGENNGYKIEGFDLDNSPYRVSKAKNLRGRTVVHRSTQGTQGIVSAKKADEIIFGSFVTIGAIVDYIFNKRQNVVSIVAMDDVGTEDDIFADYLIAKLKKQKVKTKKEIALYLSKQQSAAKFLNPHIAEFPKEDFNLCLDINRFDFFPLVKETTIVKYKFNHKILENSV